MTKKNEETPLRVVHIAAPSQKAGDLLPVFFSSVQAGFPSPADDYIENQLDLNNLLIKHPAATFFVRVEGESMIDANIYSGDILIVDRSIEASNGKIVVAVLNGDFTVKRLVVKPSGRFLLPENKKFLPLKIDQNAEFQIWGVVTYIIHKSC